MALGATGVAARGEVCLILLAAVFAGCGRLGSACPGSFTVLLVPFDAFWRAVPFAGKLPNGGKVLELLLAARPLGMAMSGKVFGLSNRHKVFRRVVERVAIAVMNDMAIWNGAVIIDVHLPVVEGFEPEPDRVSVAVIDAEVSVSAVRVAVVPCAPVFDAFTFSFVAFHTAILSCAVSASIRTQPRSVTQTG